MNGLDQAFIKAFAKDRAPATTRSLCAPVREQWQPPLEDIESGALALGDGDEQSQLFRIDRPSGDVCPLRPHMTLPLVEHVNSYDLGDLVQVTEPSVVFEDRLIPLGEARHGERASPSPGEVLRDAEPAALSHVPARQAPHSCQGVGAPVDAASSAQCGRAAGNSAPASSTSAAVADRDASPAEPPGSAVPQSQPWLAAAHLHAPHLMTQELGWFEQAALPPSLDLVTTFQIAAPGVGLAASAPSAVAQREADTGVLADEWPEDLGAPADAVAPAEAASFADESSVISAEELAAVTCEGPSDVGQAPEGVRAFAPAWEVDLFRWPEMCRQLDEATGGRLAQSGHELYVATRDGLRVLAVTSSRRREGRSTVALALARAAALCGCHVALVDGDADQPRLSRRLGVEAPCDWREVLRRGQPLHEASIVSLADRVTLFPSTLSVPDAGPLDSVLLHLLRELRRRFELVIVDLPPRGATVEPGRGEPGPIDMAVVVRDVKCTSRQESLATVAALRAEGVRAVGVIENFTRPEKAS